MNLSYRWLAEYVDLTGVSPGRLAELLTAAGVAVDVVESRNAGVSGAVIGQVLACHPHPQADRLSVCSVDVGVAAPLTIVCGAANVAAGQRVVVAVPGASLPGGTIAVARLRGVESHGMICSAAELGLPTDLLSKEATAGIYVLPADAVVGADAVQALGLDDWVLELDLTPNRSDCLSIRGLAYEVAALLNRPNRFPLADQGAAPPQSGQLRVTLQSPACTLYEAQVLAVAQAAPSPLWLQARLLAAGIRPVNRIVDVTNYVMVEWGQPLHAFDADQVQGQTVIVRQARLPETLLTLDGVDRELTADTLVIADQNRVIGIAGVMGGRNSEITETTSRVLLESARFDPVSIRRTGVRLGLTSQAQQRFEKGVDPLAVASAINRAVSLLQEVTGASAVGPRIRVENEPSRAAGAVRTGEIAIPFSPVRCNRLLGTAISAQEMKDVLRRLGLSVADVGDGSWQVEVPSRRQDLRMEEDLMEEVGRLCGYDVIPSTLPIGPTTIGVRNRSQQLRKLTRTLLTGAGMMEVFPSTLTSPAAMLPLRLPAEHPLWRQLPLLRPLSEERTVLRTHLLPGLAAIAGFNLARESRGGQIFEIGHLYQAREWPVCTQPQEPWHWGGLWFGELPAAFGSRSRNADFLDVKGVLQTWLDAIGLTQATFARADVPWLHPGRSADVCLAGQAVGTFGELHPETAAALRLPGALFADVNLDLCLDQITGVVALQSVPKFPASRRDLAVVVRDAVPVQDLAEAALATNVRHSGGVRLERCDVFDVYAGPNVEPGTRSVAFALVFRDVERTLTDDEVDVAVADILGVWEERYGAALRST